MWRYFKPYSFHATPIRRNVKVRQNPILSSVNWIAQGGGHGARGPLGYIPESDTKIQFIRHRTKLRRERR